MKRQNVKYYLAGAVSLITLAVYLPSLQNGFVEWDDSAYVFENLHIRSFSPAFFKWAFFDFYAANWHPLTWISHALDYSVWGLNPMGHHLTNNVLHAMNTFLVVLLVVRLLEAINKTTTPAPPYQGGELVGPNSFPPILGGKAKGRGGKRKKILTQNKLPLPLNQGGEFNNRFTTHGSSAPADPPVAGTSRFTLIAAAVTGLLFGLHPLHVESVAWVAERKDLLCALFFLLSIVSYITYTTNRTYKNYLLTFAFFTLALMSKPMAVTLPFVLLILDWYPFKRVHSLKTFSTVFTEKLPFVALSLVSSILTILAQKAGSAILSAEEVSFLTRALVAAKSLTAYLGKMILPLHLIPFYPYPKDVSLLSAGFLFAILVVIGITTISSVAAKKQKLWLSVWGYYVITLMPVIGIVQTGSQAMADRYAYLPSIGPFLVAGLVTAWGIAKLDAMSKKALSAKLLAAAAALFLLVSMTFITIKQIAIWKNSIDLWSYELDREPGIYFAYNNRGITYYNMGQVDQAIEDYKKAIALYPTYLNSHYNLGMAFFKKGWLDQAIEEYSTAVRLNPQYVYAHLGLGVAYAKKGLIDKFLEEYQAVARLNPGSAETYYQLGSFLNDAGFPDRAVEQLQMAVRMKPDFAEAHNNLAAALYRQGRIADALEHYLIYTRLHPDNAVGHLNLGSAYAALGHFDKAIEQFQYALRLNPGYVDAYYNLGMAYQAKGFMDQAVEQLEAAARLNPADAAIRNDLDRVYALKKTGGRPGLAPGQMGTAPSP